MNETDPSSLRYLLAAFDMGGSWRSSLKLSMSEMAGIVYELTRIFTQVGK